MFIIICSGVAPDPLVARASRFESVVERMAAAVVPAFPQYCMLLSEIFVFVACFEAEARCSVCFEADARCSAIFSLTRN